MYWRIYDQVKRRFTSKWLRKNRTQAKWGLAMFSQAPKAPEKQTINLEIAIIRDQTFSSPGSPRSNARLFPLESVDSDLYAWGDDWSYIFKEIFRCASISWFEVVTEWVSQSLMFFTASASTGLSDLFIFFLEEVRKRGKFIKLRKCWGGRNVSKYWGDRNVLWKSENIQTRLLSDFKKIFRNWPVLWNWVHFHTRFMLF